MNVNNIIEKAREERQKSNDFIVEDWSGLEPEFVGIFTNYNELKKFLKDYYKKSDYADVFIHIDFKGVEISGGQFLETNKESFYRFIDDVINLNIKNNFIKKGNN